MESTKEGVYIPPFCLAQQMEEITKQKLDGVPEAYVGASAKKNLNGIINKLNISNFTNAIYELFNEKLLSGHGLLAKSLLKGQLAAPNYTQGYCCDKSKLPEVGSLIVNRVISKFKKVYRRNDKLMCIGYLKMIAHLFNQQIVHDSCHCKWLHRYLARRTDFKESAVYY